jgi:hypothetical protein
MSLTHTLQRMAGKDPYFLDRASYSERVMWVALGAMTALIGLLALMSVWQGMFLVYFPEGFDRSPRHWLNLSFLAFFALAWTMIIFNFYRFALSTAFTHKSHSFISLLPRLVLQLFFGLLIGLSISLPLSVVLGHQEFKDNSTQRQEKLISNIYKTIDTKHEAELTGLYAELTQRLQSQQVAVLRLETYQSFRADPNAAEAVQAAANEAADSANQIREKIGALRKKIEEAKKDIESTIHANDGLMTNIKKAIEKNKIMMVLMSVFICMTLIATTLFEAFFSPGLYEYLVEYNNHVTLASHGVTTASKKIFITSESVAQPHYSYPEELLREQKRKMAQLSREDITQFKS